MTRRRLDAADFGLPYGGPPPAPFDLEQRLGDATRDARYLIDQALAARQLAETWYWRAEDFGEALRELVMALDRGRGVKPAAERARALLVQEMPGRYPPRHRRQQQADAAPAGPDVAGDTPSTPATSTALPPPVPKPRAGVGPSATRADRRAALREYTVASARQAKHELLLNPEPPADLNGAGRNR